MYLRKGHTHIKTRSAPADRNICSLPRGLGEESVQCVTHVNTMLERPWEQRLTLEEPLFWWRGTTHTAAHKEECKPPSHAPGRGRAPVAQLCSRDYDGDTCLLSPPTLTKHRHLRKRKNRQSERACGCIVFLTLEI